jgi:hypothetical protein
MQRLSNDLRSTDLSGEMSVSNGRGATPLLLFRSRYLPPCRRRAARLGPLLALGDPQHEQEAGLHAFLPSHGASATVPAAHTTRRTFPPPVRAVADAPTPHVPPPTLCPHPFLGLSSHHHQRGSFSSPTALFTVYPLSLSRAHFATDCHSRVGHCSLSLLVLCSQRQLRLQQAVQPELIESEELTPVLIVLPSSVPQSIADKDDNEDLVDCATLTTASRRRSTLESG